MRFTAFAHEQLSQVIRLGDIVIDATIGNGHDTLFLADKVGPSGHVYGFDVQDEALRRTAARLTQQHLQDRVTLILSGHQQMRMSLPAGLVNSIAAVTFNLGYLPGGNKQLTTQAGTSLSALKQSLELLRPNGIITLLVYVGHTGGGEEMRAVRQWLEAVRETRVHVTECCARTERSPVLFLLRKTAALKRF